MGERSIRNSAVTAADLRLRCRVRGSVAGKLLREDVEGGAFLAKAGQGLYYQREGTRNLIRYSGWSDSKGERILPELT